MIYVAIAILLVTLVLGVPVPISFMASAAWLLFFGGPEGAGYEASQLLPYAFSQINSVSLIAIAMFIMAGGIMERGKIGEKLIDLVDVFVGHIRGAWGSWGPSPARSSARSPVRPARRFPASGRSCSRGSRRGATRGATPRPSWRTPPCWGF